MSGAAPTKAVLVSGGSGGIGAAVCRAAARASWAVFVGYRSGAERAEALAEEIRGAGGRARPVRLPLEDPAAIAEALEAVAAAADRLDALVLCASPAPVLERFVKTSDEALLEQFRTNVIGNKDLLAAVWKRFFHKQGGGHAVAVSSSFAEAPPKPQMAAYVIDKRGLQALLECALAELGPSGLRASVVSPGYTDTPMLQALHPLIVETARATQKDGVFLAPKQVAERVLRLLENPPAGPALAVDSLSNDKPGA